MQLSHFYQLLREDDHHKSEFHDGITARLDLPNYFYYTGQGGAPHLRKFTDESVFYYTIKAKRKLGWSPETIDAVLATIAGLLHMGQIKFREVEVDGNEMAEEEKYKSLSYAAKLLGVDCDQMRCAPTERIVLAL